MDSFGKVTGFYRENTSLCSPSETVLQEIKARKKSNFLVIRGPQLGLSFNISRRDRLIVGRSDDADVQIYGKGISRKHFCIFKLGSKVFIDDMQSSNGTYVNKKRVTGFIEIFSEDRIYIGVTTVLQFI